MLPTSQNIASSTPKAPNNDRADYRDGCRYSPIGMSVVGSHYKNINRPQQCGYARCPINRISETRDHGSIHRVRLPRPCNPPLNCSRSRKCKQKGSCRMSSWLRQIHTTPRILKLQFPGWETWPARAAAKQRAPSCPTCCCGTATLNNYRRVRPASRPIQPFCDLRATAMSLVTRYGAIQQSVWLQTMSHLR